MSNKSFLPEDYLERRVQRRTTLVMLVLFLLVMGGVVGVFGYLLREQRAALAERQHINALTQEAAKRLEQLDELQARKQQMIQKAKVTAALLEKVPRTLLLAELINNMPGTLSLLELELSSRVVQQRSTATNALDKAKQDNKKKLAEAAEPTVPEYEVTLNLVGVAPTDVQVAQYMTALGQCALLSDLNLGFSEEVVIEEEKMRKFRIEMKVNTKVDVQKVEPTLVKRELKQNPMGGTIQIDPSGNLVSQPIERPTAVPAADKAE